MKTSLYAIHNTDNIRGMAQAVAHMLTHEERMECQILTTPQGGRIVQAKESSVQAKKLIHMSFAITIQIDPLTNGTAEVRIWNNSWVRNSSMMAVYIWHPFWPVVITSTIEMRKLNRLAEKIDRAFQIYLAGIDSAAALDSNVVVA